MKNTTQDNDATASRNRKILIGLSVGAMVAAFGLMLAQALSEKHQAEIHERRTIYADCGGEYSVLSPGGEDDGWCVVHSRKYYSLATDSVSTEQTVVECYDNKELTMEVCRTNVFPRP